MKYAGRRKPYTQRGIARVPCSRCKKPSVHQWQICANGRFYLGVCLDCDVLMNKVALELMRVPNRRRLLAAYRARTGA